MADPGTDVQTQETQSSQPIPYDIGGADSPFAGLNLSVAGTAIGGNEFQILKGCLSMGAALRPCFAMNPIWLGSSAFYWADVVQILNTCFALLFGTDGSLTAVDLSTGAPVAAAAAGTFSSGLVTIGGKPMRPAGAGWKNAIGLIVDPAKGYFSFSGSTVGLLDDTVKGHAIDTYRQRVWIGYNRDVSFTAAGSYTDFNVADAAGSTSIPDADMLGPLVGIKAVGTYLFYLGTAWAGVTSYTDVQNGLPLFDLQPFGTAIGPVLQGGFDVVAGTLFSAGGKQAWALTSPSPPNLAVPLGDAYGAATMAHGMVHGQTAAFFHIAATNRIFALAAGYWFEVAAPANVIRLDSAWINNEPHAICFAGTGSSFGIYDLTPQSGAFQTATARGKNLDFGMRLYGKTGIQAGVWGTAGAAAQAVQLSLVNEQGAVETHQTTPPEGNFFSWNGYSTYGKEIAWEINVPASSWETQITGVHIDAQLGDPW